MQSASFVSATCTALLLAGLALHGAAVAQSVHYRWVDTEGKTVMSDRPPAAGVDYEIVSSTSSYSRKVTAKEGAVLADDADITSEASAAATEANAERARQAEQACGAARANLEALRGDATIVVRTPDGGQRELSPEEIELQRQTAQSQVETYCR